MENQRIKHSNGIKIPSSKKRPDKIFTMKKFTLLLCSAFIMQFANSQKLIIDDGVPLKKGIYKTFDEFKNNSPSFSLDFEIVSADTGVLYRLKIDKEKTDLLGVVWGFCDGKNSYINLDYNMSKKRIFRPVSEFSKITYLGRYCYFRTYQPGTSLVFRDLLAMVIDINSGEELCLNCAINFGFISQSSFKKILTKDSELWSEYKNDKSKEDLFLKYIKKYSERHKDEVIN
jgi:hypothetical protein